jgi:MoaA/NifB/PqqE/SkfB family radical SAM enzyme
MGRVYNRYKIFWHADKLNSLLTNVIQPPVHIRIKPTNTCNHKCWYCAFRLKSCPELGQTMVDADSIPRKKMRELVNDINNMGVKAVTFSGGGEPLCYEHIYEFIDRLRTQVSVLTNGALLSGSIAELLAKKATWVRVSIDGWDSLSYSQYRDVPETEFDVVLKNIQNYHGYIGASVIVDKRNCEHIYDIITMLYICGVHSIKVAPVIMSAASTAMDTYHENITDIVNEQVQKSIHDFPYIEINNSFHTQLQSFAKEYTWCPYGQITPIIGADCNVYYCHDKAYNPEGLLGSIKDKSFSRFWFDGKEKFYRINPSMSCDHHCMCDTANKNIIEYLQAEHQDFI